MLCIIFQDEQLNKVFHFPCNMFEIYDFPLNAKKLKEYEKQ